MTGQVGALVVHGEQDSVQFEPLVERRPDPVEGLHEFRDTFERQVLALHRNQDSVGRSQGVDRQETEGRGTVDEHVLEPFAHRRERFLEAELATRNIDELDFDPDQVPAGRRDRKELELRAEEDLVDASLA